MSKASLTFLFAAATGLSLLIGESLIGSEVPGLARDAPQNLPVASIGGSPQFRYLAPGDIALETDEFGKTLPAATGENFVARDRNWKSESLVVNLPLDGAVEYKAIMRQGDTLVFDWSVHSGEVYYDFHAHDEAFGDAFFTRYDEGEGDARKGAILAAYDGQHGWFWLNIADGPTTVTLNVAGFYSEIIKIDAEGY
ncbi:hypothetical protein N9V98_08155 [Luminiphilus sp.]|nr:hypothetical protein [Luminiphilus sp.]